MLQCIVLTVLFAISSALHLPMKPTHGACRALSMSANQSPSSSNTDSRREFVSQAVLSAFSAISLPALFPAAAYASGGATAGKYTTIPIAKRRYYGRVQQAVHEFLLIGPSIVKGDLGSAPVVNFFDPKGIVVVEGLSFSKEGR